MKKVFFKKLKSGLAIIAVLTLSIMGGAEVFGYTQAVTVQTVTTVSDADDEIIEKTEAEKSNENISITGSIGYDGNYIVNKITPFNISISNSGEDIEGEIQVKVYTNNFYNYEGEESNIYSLYYQPIELPKGSTKGYKMEIPLTAIRKNYLISIVDKSGNVIASKNIPTNALDPGTVMVGVLSDAPESLNYLKNLKLAQSNVSGVNYDNITFLNEDSFPSSKSIIDNFKVIIINDFDTKQLSSEQVQTLKSWIINGGMLVLGTGINAEKVLSGINDIVEYSIGDSKLISSVNLLGAELNQISNFTVSDIKIDGSKVQVSQDNNTITSNVEMGEGNIVIHSFDMGLSPIKDISDIDTFFKEVYTKIDPEYFVVNSEDDYYYYDSISNRIPFFLSSGIYFVFIGICIYILLIGPGLYFILKKKDKRELGWVLIPISAVVFTCMIFVLGLNSKYHNNIVNVISKIEVAGTDAVADISVNTRSPKGGNMTISTDEKLNFKVSEERYRYDNENKEIIEFKKLAGQKDEITYFDCASWESKTFKADKSFKITGEVTGDLKIQDGSIVGKLTNNTGIDFEDVVLSAFNSYSYIGDFINGQTIDVKYEIETENWQDIYDFVHSNFEDRYRNEKALNPEENFKLYQRGRMLRDSVNEKYNNGIYESDFALKLFGFNDENILSSDILVNGKVPTTIVGNMYSFNFDVDIYSGDKFSIPYGYIKASEVTMYGNKYEYDYLYNTVYTYNGGEMQIYYDIDNVENITMFQFDFVYGQGTKGNFEIYNTSKDEWEKLQEDEYISPLDYLSSDNRIKLRIDTNSDQEISIPNIRLEGGKDAANK